MELWGWNTCQWESGRWILARRIQGDGHWVGSVGEGWVQAIRNGQIWGGWCLSGSKQEAHVYCGSTRGGSFAWPLSPRTVFMWNQEALMSPNAIMKSVT